MGTSTPLMVRAKSTPTFRAQASRPLAISSPRPSRWAIRSTHATRASPSPQGTRSGMSPFSEASMRAATATPTEIVSSPYALQSWLARAMARRSETRHREPRAARVSYSGPPYSGRTSLPKNSVRTTRLQRMGQPAQVSRSTRIVFLSVSPPISWAESNTPSWKFLVGRIPISESQVRPRAVPYSPKRTVPSSARSSRANSARARANSSGSARGFSVWPFTATALRSLLPMTAPKPGRPAARLRS